VIPADLPAIGPAALERVLVAASDRLAASHAGVDRAALVVLVPDRAGEGTNLLLLSRRASSRSTSAQGAAPRTRMRPRGPGQPTWSSRARSSSTSTRRTTCSQRRPPARRRVGRAPVSDGVPGPARLEVLALDGIPEVHPGDDLAGLVGDALERTAGALPCARTTSWW